MPNGGNNTSFVLAIWSSEVKTNHHISLAATPELKLFPAIAMLMSFNYPTYQITPTRTLNLSPNHFYARHFGLSLPLKFYRKFPVSLFSYSSPAISNDVTVSKGLEEEETKENRSDRETNVFNFDGSFELAELNRFNSPVVEVKELEDLPEQWRRSKLAWLCKELPAHRSGTFLRVLNAQRKWIRQVDCTYISVHFMRIRENEAAFRVYKWMMQQHWFQFDFALATKLADYMGKDRKHSKCREVFDDIINQGLIPNESTFHILIIAYLSSNASNCLEEACDTYNRMILLGGYKPRLSLHNSVFRALVSKTESSCKHHLKQAEFIFQNLTTSGLEIHDDIYGGLIWLHSYQDVIDRDRISLLRESMNFLRTEERADVLVSMLRACAKEGDLVEAERTWKKILSSNSKPPTQASVYLMEVYSRVGKPMQSLKIFRFMQERNCSNVAAFNKIIEILCKAQEIELAESLMIEFINSGMKPLMKSFLDLMEMYSNLRMHDKLETSFFLCLEKCHPNRTIYGMYLDSLVQIGSLEKAEDIFTQMHGNEAIGISAKSCNVILMGYLISRQYLKAKKIYDLMCQKKYDVDPSLMEKLQHVLNSNHDEVKKSIKMNLTKEQREILIALLLSGLRVEMDEEKKNYAIHFFFKVDSLLKRHVYNQFRDWLAYEFLVDDDKEEIPGTFITIPHSYFKFYAEQFRSQGKPLIPKVIHRWLTPRVLAYWYMYGGYKTSSGDILLKLPYLEEDAMRIVKSFKEKSLDCRVKKKGTIFWVGFLGCNAAEFQKIIEPFHMDLS